VLSEIRDTVTVNLRTPRPSRQQNGIMSTALTQNENFTRF